MEDELLLLLISRLRSVPDAKARARILLPQPQDNPYKASGMWAQLVSSVQELLLFISDVSKKDYFLNNNTLKIHFLK